MSFNLMNGKIRVYNYQKNPVGFPSQIAKEGVYLTGRAEDEEYVMERVLWEDIEVENNKSDVFKIGRLRFHPNEEKEVYEKLGITDLENIKSDNELIELLKNDSLSNLKYIMKLKSTLLVTRMKNLLFEMERGGSVPPHLVIEAVNERVEELKGLPRNLNSNIHKMIEREKQELEDNKLKETLAQIQKDMAKMKEEKEESIEKIKSEKIEVEEKSKNALEEMFALINQLKAENEALRQEKEVKEISVEEPKSTSTKPRKKKIEE